MRFAMGWCNRPRTDRRQVGRRHKRRGPDGNRAYIVGRRCFLCIGFSRHVRVISWIVTHLLPTSPLRAVAHLSGKPLHADSLISDKSIMFTLIPPSRVGLYLRHARTSHQQQQAAPAGKIRVSPASPTGGKRQMDSNSWDPRLRPHRAESIRLVSSLTADASFECNSFVLETCSCRICGVGQPEDLQSFAAEVCPCEVCRTSTDRPESATDKTIERSLIEA